MAERLAALVLRQGQTEAVPMSLQRAALAKGQGGYYGYYKTRT